jgi:2-(1,2-epoxy-1,2-dihydrophenyl)acetyl-CoA isomerase
MTWEHVRFDVADRVATVTLDRPEHLNALFGTMREDLQEAVAMALGKARAIVITGAGKAFCSGGDVNTMATLRRDGNVEEVKRLMRAGREVVELLRGLPLPTLAAVNGVAAGAGLSLALACDVRIASRDARLGASFSRVGLHPDWGGSFFLPRLVGTGAACELIFTGRMLSAEEAFRIGLVNRVVNAEEFPAKVSELAHELAEAPPRAIRWAKEAIYDAPHMSLDEILDLEEEAQADCFASEDALEGLSAFEEKRSPRFRGR